MEIKSIKKVNESAFLQNLEKAYTEGIYSDTPANRKLGRVGMSYAQYAEKVKKEQGGEQQPQQKQEQQKQKSVEKEEKVVNKEEKGWEDLSNKEKVTFLNKNYKRDSFGSFILQDGRDIRHGEDGWKVMDKIVNYQKQYKTIDDDEALDLIYKEGITKQEAREIAEMYTYISHNYKTANFGRGGGKLFPLKGYKDIKHISYQGGSWFQHSNDENGHDTLKKLKPKEAMGLIEKYGTKKEIKNPFE